MNTLSQKTKRDLEVVAQRLTTIGINVTVSVTREGTPGEYPSLLIWKENLQPAMQNILELRRIINPYYNEDRNTFSGDLCVELGYTTDSEVIEIKPRYSYLLESERKQLGY